MDIMGIFKKKKDDIDLKAVIAQNNELMRAIYQLTQTNLPLNKDSDDDKYITEGMEGNSDVFGIIMQLATIFSRVKFRLVQTNSQGEEKEVENHELLDILRKPNFFQSGQEFRMAWALFKYTTGNSIVYVPRLGGGMNSGKVNRNGMTMMPTQNTEIISKNWREPIGWYVLDIDHRVKIEAKDVWHERFPSLQYEEGRNLMGLSPLKAAMNTINIQNAGEEMAAKLYRGGHPPGIVSKKEGDANTMAEQESNFRKKWKSKYQREIDIPIFTLGELTYTKIGYDNLKDLQLLEMDEMGRKKLCIALGVPPELFGASRPTYNNMHDAKKALYENRIIPDFEQWIDGLNGEIVPAYGENLKLVPDYSDIEVLQEDKERKAKIFQVGVNIGAYSPNEFREKMGDDPVDDPAMDDRYIQQGKIPVSFASDGGGEMSEAENNKWYRNMDLENGM